MMQNQSLPDDEIDLSRIWSGFKKLISYPFQLWYNNKKTTLLFILLAVLLAFSLKLVIPKTYRTSFIIRPTDKTEKFHLKIIGDIQTLLKQKDYVGLSDALNVPVNTASLLVFVETVHPAIKYGKDSINCTEIFIETSDYTHFETIQNGILHYLSNTPYFLKLRDLQKNQIELELKHVDLDLIKLDSLKKLQLKQYDKLSTSSNNQLLINDLINPTASYNTANERFGRKMDLIARTAFLDTFQLIKPVLFIKKAYWPPRVLMMCVVLIPLFLFFCFVFLHFKTKRHLNN